MYIIAFRGGDSIGIAVEFGFDFSDGFRRDSIIRDTRFDDGRYEVFILVFEKPLQTWLC